MLKQSILAGLIASLLAGCTFAPPSVLPPIRDGSHSGAREESPKLEPEPALQPGPGRGPSPSTRAAAQAARPATAGSVPRASVRAGALSPRRQDGPRTGRDERREVAREERKAEPLPPLPGAGLPDRGESSPVAALVASAREAAEAGQPGRAAAALERALKVEPRNPRLWHRLALVRLGQGRHAEAVALALRSKSLTAGDPDLDSRNWRLIAASRGRMGDEEGAREALERAGAR